MDMPLAWPHSTIALFMQSLAGGGVQRNMLTLAAGLAQLGHRVDLVVCRAEGAHHQWLPAGVSLVVLGPSMGWRGRCLALMADPKGVGALLRPVLLAPSVPWTLRYLPDLVVYLRRARPDVLFSAVSHVNLLALWSRRLAGVATRVVISERTALSSETATRRKWRWRHLPALIQRVYPWADAIVAVSKGVAEDLARTAGLPRERITTIYNPVVTADLQAQARAPLDHAWFAPGAAPVVLGAGRLLKQKDFPTLIRAFAKVRAQRPARLVILGEGAKRRQLEALIEDLGLGAHVVLPGYVNNPFAYMARAAVFVLSSAYEGLPGVLIQALACGTPVVATNCPHGPAEILDSGRYGRLVPVGDASAMAKAIIATLDEPPERRRLRARSDEFCVERAMRSYRQVLASGTDAAIPAVSRSMRSSGWLSRQRDRSGRPRS